MAARDSLIQDVYDALWERCQRSDGKLGGRAIECYFYIREKQEGSSYAGRNSFEMNKREAGLGIEEFVEFVNNDKPSPTDEQLQSIHTHWSEVNEKIKRQVENGYCLLKEI